MTTQWPMPPPTPKPPTPAPPKSPKTSHASRPSTGLSSVIVTPPISDRYSSFSADCDVVKHYRHMTKRMNKLKDLYRREKLLRDALIDEKSMTARAKREIEAERSNHGSRAQRLESPLTARNPSRLSALCRSNRASPLTARLSLDAIHEDAPPERGWGIGNRLIEGGPRLQLNRDQQEERWQLGSEI